MRDQAKKILDKRAALEKKLIECEGLSRDELVDTQKKLAEISDVSECAQRYLKIVSEQETVTQELDQTTDAEWGEYLQKELASLNEKLQDERMQFCVALLPKDIADRRNAIVEVRAGTGGDEAALFAADLLRMYLRYASNKGWKAEILSMSETEKNGVKEAILSVKGKNVFENLKFESGGHRVQRVPETESQGRVHTSAATVAVLPEAEDVDISIDMNDLRIDVFRSSGPGGQSVNTTDSAVRITHLPTGIVVQQQDEKSQHKNKDKAMKILKARLYEQERKKQMDARASDRQKQVGSGDRSERIRTYNFPQDRFVDHRLDKRFSDLPAILDGEKLDEIIQLLLEHDRAEKLAQLA